MQLLLLLLLLLASCWRSPSAQPRAQARMVGQQVSLAIDREPPGQLVVDRDGRAWQAQCDGSRLRVRPRQGGDACDRGPCIHTYSGSPDVDDDALAIQPIAIDADTAAIYLDRSRELVVTTAAGERRYPIGQAIHGMKIRIDGAALVRSSN